MRLFSSHQFQLLLWFLFITSVNCFPQSNPLPQENIETLVEELFALQDENISYSELYETLLQKYVDPINLNETDPDQLRELYILSDVQIRSIFFYLKRNGPLLSIYELQAIPGLDRETIQRILPFVLVREISTKSGVPLIKRIFKTQNNYLLIRYSRKLNTEAGFTSQLQSDGTSTARYAGSPGNLYMRFRSKKMKDYSIGFTAEKDAGEMIQVKPSQERYGMDFYSYHFMLENRGKLKHIVLGDYQLQYGQSLILGAGFNIGKGSETVRTIRRNNLGIRPYTSVVEQGYFRGAAATFSIKDVEITSFYSNLNQDLSSVTFKNPASGYEQLTSFNIRESGLHRTTSEIEGKNKINEQTAGVNILYAKPGGLQAGITFIDTHFSESILKQPTLSNQFDFSGSHNFNIGIFSTYNWQNMSFFGELAASKSAGIGAIAGVVSSLSRSIDFSILYRHYDKDFHSIQGRGFGESSNTKNESGIYWGTKVKINKRLSLNAYYDSFKFPWLRSRINRPSKGYEYLLRLTYKPSKKILVYSQFREEAKDQNINDSNSPIQSVGQRIKRNYAFSTLVTASNRLSLRSRIQFSSLKFNGQVTSGYAIAQDLNIDLGKLRLSCRVALFDTDDFDNRQYIYERNVLYSFSIPAYQGVGTRQYVMAQFKPGKKIDLWIRYALSAYRDRDHVGNGLDEIDSNTKRDLRAQLRYKF